MLALKNVCKFHALAIFAIVIAVLFSGCQAAPSGEKSYLEERQRLVDECVEQWKEHFEDTDQQIIKTVQTSNGATVMLGITASDTVITHFASAVYANKDHIIESTGVGAQIGEYDSRIFYNDDWDFCNSSMRKIYTSTGTDVIILITPNYREFYGKTYGEEVSYKDSVEYGLSPYDTRNSDFTPIYATPDNPDDDQIDGPMWMLVLSFEDLEEDYELHYGEFVLTYDDIKNGTWEP